MTLPTYSATTRITGLGLLIALCIVAFAPQRAIADGEITDRERVAAWVISNCTQMKPGEAPQDALVRKFKEVTGFARPQLDFDSGAIPAGKGATDIELRWTCRVRFYTPLEAEKNTQEAKRLAMDSHWKAKDSRTGADVFVELKPESQKALITFLRIRGGIYVRVVVTVSAGPNAEVKELIEEASQRWHFFYSEAERLQLYLPLPNRLTARDINPDITELALNTLPFLTAETLLEVGDSREGVAADGVTSLLLVAKFENPGKVRFELNEGDGKVEAFFATNPFTARKVGEDTDDDGEPDTEIEYYGFALYTPPDHFQLQRPKRWAGTSMHYRDVPVQFTFTPELGEPKDYEENIKLVRPPLLLVHGTFDDPQNCWNQISVEGERSFADALSLAGFYVSLVDYKATNGSGGGFLFGDDPAFKENARVLMDNSGGIEETLDVFRDEHNIAVTQVDVVGHSLGGLIARLWASPAYNDEYERPGNFKQGDIHRIITIGTPHYGSDLAKVLRWLEGVKPEEHGVVAAASADAFTRYVNWINGACGEGGAVFDQLPRTEALQNLGPTALTKIGATKIPAHAIVCVTEPYGYIEPDVATRLDPDQEYLSSLEWTGKLFFNNPILLEKFFEDDEMLEEGEFIVDLLDSQTHYWLPPENDERDWLERLDFADVENEQVSTKEILEYFRMAIFGFDDNDCTVRAESQLGGLDAKDPSESTRIDGSKTWLGRGVLHGKAPRYAVVQNAVVAVLNDDRFASSGFEPAGRQMNYREPPLGPSLSGLTRDRRIIWSGMVKEHADAFAQVASNVGTVLIGRPVNPDSTRLIADHASTKDMAVKGKSSTWGPHQGLIPTNQRYSKLWRTMASEPEKRQAEIEEYDGKVQELLAPANEENPTRPEKLTVRAGNEDFDVVYVKVKDISKSDAEREVMLRRTSDGTLWDWRNGQDNDYCRDLPPVRRIQATENQTLVHMQVLADKLTGKYLTADYDLLAIGFHQDDRRSRAVLPEDLLPKVGKITQPQHFVLLAINHAVTKTGFQGGNVVHHGPETNYFYKKKDGKWDGSPYVDYPLIVFEPKLLRQRDIKSLHNGPARIRLILQGPEGYRDINLKRYFDKARRRHGWVLNHNPHAPGWQWEKDDEREMWVESDAANLPNGVPQIPRPAESRTLVHQSKAGR